jgi:hypothetical protein
MSGFCIIIFIRRRRVAYPQPYYLVQTEKTWISTKADFNIFVMSNLFTVTFDGNLVKCNFIFDLIYCVYSAMTEIPKQLLSCQKRAELSVILVIFDGVLCDISTYTRGAVLCFFYNR